MIKLIQGDCLEKMKEIDDKSIDMICCDLPYGITACKWDTVIPFEPLWKQYKRVIKDNGAVVLFGSEPFASYLRMSNIKWYKYDWVWKKTQAVGYLSSYKRPLRKHELILIFCNGQTIYNYQLENKPIRDIRPYSKGGKTDCYGNVTVKQIKTRKIPLNKKMPSSILTFSNEQHTVHSTQKPVVLVEYLIKTYTNENDIVLDNCMGSGTAGIACVRINRSFIGIELDEEYFKIAEKRIKDTKRQKGHMRKFLKWI